VLDGTVTVKTADAHEVILRGSDIKPENTSDRPKKHTKEPEESKPKKQQRGHQRPESSHSRKGRGDSGGGATEKKEKP
jgi:hypothetical protein